MIKYSPNLEGQELLTSDTLSMLEKAGKDSKNPDINITSLWRSPARQAQAMYDNISNNVIIGYLEPGQIVTKLCQQLLKEKQPKAAILKAMEEKIIELANQNKLVSLHCVSKEAYSTKNVIDISKDSKQTPNPRDFVKALMKDHRLLKVLTPFTSDYNDKRVVFSSAEAAIHIEIDASKIEPPVIEEPEIEPQVIEAPEMEPQEDTPPVTEFHDADDQLIAPPADVQPDITKADPPKANKNIFQKIIEFISRIFSRKS
jgi:hypothetical protein